MAHTAPATPETRTPAPAGADPLRAAEQAAVTFEVLSVLRHDLRNKLAPMRNVIAYVRRRVQGTDLWQSDPRLGKFLELMETEIAAASALMESPPALHEVFAREAGPSPAMAAVELALSAVRHAGRGRIGVDGAPGDTAVDADHREVALALRGLLENALEVDDGEVRLGVGVDAERVDLEVRDRGPGLTLAAFHEAVEGRAPRRPGRVGLSLKTAHRVARRYGGDLALRPADEGTRIALVLPRARQ